MERKVSVRKHSVVDHKTGEITSEIESVSYPFSSEEPYVKLYIKHACYLQGLIHSEYSVLYKALKHLDYENEVVLLKRRKEKIAKDLGISINTVNNTLFQMVKKKVLFRIEKGFYKVNPYLFGRGSWKNIKKLRMTIDYNPNDYKVKTTIVRGKNGL